MRHLRRTLTFGFAALTLAACASARRPVIRETRAQILAHELEEAAERAHESARDERRRDRDEHRAVRALAELAQRARHFHRQIEDHDRGPRHTRADFIALNDAYHDASRWVDELDRRAPRRAFRRVGELLRELHELYDYRDERRDDRHDRDRDSRRYIQYHYDR